jgi:hypothetical protein
VFVVGKRFWRGGTLPRISKNDIAQPGGLVWTDTTANIER